MTQYLCEEGDARMIFFFTDDVGSTLFDKAPGSKSKFPVSTLAFSQIISGHLL
jgi:hypothetical protein